MHCKSKGKVFSLVIDSASYEKIVSQDMVNKLKLKESHPKTYLISWFKKVNEHSLWSDG